MGGGKRKGGGGKWGDGKGGSGYNRSGNKGKGGKKNDKKSEDNREAVADNDVEAVADNDVEAMVENGVEPGKEEASREEEAPQELSPASVQEVSQPQSEKVQKASDEAPRSATGEAPSPPQPTKQPMSPVLESAAKSKEHAAAIADTAQEGTSTKGSTEEIPLQAEQEVAKPSSATQGATGEAPDVEEASTAEEPEEQDDFSGTYMCKSPDGVSEHTLRLQAGGAFWHAAHRTGEMKRKVIDKNVPGDQADAKIETVPVWELAEALGEWRILGKVPSSGSTITMIEFKCNHTKWSSDHPVAPLMLKPTDDGQRNMDKMIEEGRMRLVYSLTKREGDLKMEMLTGPQAADWSQALGSTHASMRAVQAGVQTLGFVRLYDHVG